MSSKRFFGTVMAAGLVLALLASLVSAQDFGPQGDAGMLAPLGTAFTYQGQLRSGDAPVNGACDLQFSLYDAVSAGAQIGTTQTKTNVAVSEGYFTIATLDFGAAAFQGEGRWLAIAVRCPAGSGSYVTLSPRQALTAAPYALYAKGAPWTGLSGVPAGFADGVDNNTTYSAGTGLMLSGTTFAADTAVLQRRVSGTCGSGNAIRVVNADGTVTCQAVDANAWQLTGNAGTTPGTHYLGTSDNQALELKVNGARVLRLEPNSTSPNLIGGYSGNWVITGAFGATIGGGGNSSSINQVTDAYGTVGGGIGNQAGDNMGTVTDSEYATVGGGYNNSASADGATIAGGFQNTASAMGATIAGGSYNIASATRATIAGGYQNEANGGYSTVAGGYWNYANGEYTTVGGGFQNTASSIYATVAGGAGNTASAWTTTIAGGYYNTASAESATIGGGDRNYAAAEYATIAGGGPSDLSNPSDTNNRVTDDYGTVGGGAWNWVGNGDGDTTNAPFATIGGGHENIASGWSATVGGGYSNDASGGSTTVGGGWNNTASGNAATVPGGATNIASGAYSFAAGAHAQATHAGSFVWASVEAASSWGNDTFTVRSHGGARFYTAPGTATGVQLASGGGSWSSLSDRAAKENYEVVDTREVVEWLAAIPIQTWNYKSQDPTIRHIGPVAQDFYAAFGVGEDDTHISTVDADGVALAAIQGLYQLSQEQNAHIAELEQENAALHSELDSLEARLSALERQSGHPAAATRPWPISGLALGGLALLGVVAFSRRREGGLR